MKSTVITLLFIASAAFLSLALAGDLQNLFREVNAELIAQDQQNSNPSSFVGMDKSGKIISNKTGIQPISNPIATLTHDIEEVGIERTLCYGSCPAYTFTVRQDGSFNYSGEQYVEHIGSFKGELERSVVNNVFLAIDALDYMDLNYKYSINVLDAAAVYSKVVKHGEIKVIENYASTGPGTLLAVELLIDSLIAQIDWETVENEASY